MHKRGSASIAIAALAVLLADCSSFGQSERKAVEQARNNAATAAIHDALTRTPSVIDTEIDYSDDITNPGSAHVTVVVSRGTDLEATSDAAVRAVWRSQLHPLSSILVGVGVDEDRTQGISHDYNEFEDWYELEAKYGPRPVPHSTP
jgi:hypothetical protein